MASEIDNDSALVASILRVVYAFIIASLAVLFCTITALCSTTFCYELLLLKNAYFVVLYFVAIIFLLTLCCRIYSSKHEKDKTGNDDGIVLSTVSSFQREHRIPSPIHHNQSAQDILATTNTHTTGPTIQKRVTPGAQPLPGMAEGGLHPSISYPVVRDATKIIARPGSRNRSNSILPSLHERQQIWPISTVSSTHTTEGLQKTKNKPHPATATTNIIGGFKRHQEVLFVLPEISNVILKLFVVVLTFPAMLYAVFRLAIAAEPYSPQYHNAIVYLNINNRPSPCLMSQLEMAQFALLIIYLPSLAFYVFKYGRVFSRRSPMLAGVALVHLLACNFATWFEMFTVETSRFHFRTYSALFDYFPGATNTTNQHLATGLVNNLLANSNSTLNYAACFDSSTTLRRASTESSSFLYPLFTHFLLLVTVPLLRLLFAVCCEHSQRADTEYLGSVISDIHLPPLRTANTHSLDRNSGIDPLFSGSSLNNHPNEGLCHKSNKSIFVNLFVLVAAVSLILAAHFLSFPSNNNGISSYSSGNPPRYATVRLAYYTAQIAINSILILALPIAWRGLYQLDRVSYRDSSPDPRRSIHQYNLARFSVTMVTLAISILYYLAIAVIHSAALVQLVIYYVKNDIGNDDNNKEITEGATTTKELPWWGRTTTPAALRLAANSRPTFYISCDGYTAKISADKELATTDDQHANTFTYMLPQLVFPAIAASALSLGRAASSMLLTIAQATLALLADHRSALTEGQLYHKPGRSLLMFILTASLIAWALEVAFELHTSSIGDAFATFHSLSPGNGAAHTWPVFAVFAIPITVAFKVFVSVWLYDNWLKCYSPTVI